MIVNIIKVTEGVEAESSKIFRSEDKSLVSHSLHREHKIRRYGNITTFDDAEALKAMTKFIEGSADCVQNAITRSGSDEAHPVFEFNVSNEMKIEYFKGHFELLQYLVGHSPIEAFACSKQMIDIINGYIENPYSTVVVQGYNAIPMDRFVRTTMPGTYYVTDIARINYLCGTHGLF